MRGCYGLVQKPLRGNQLSCWLEGAQGIVCRAIDTGFDKCRALATFLRTFCEVATSDMSRDDAPRFASKQSAASGVTLGIKG